MVSGRLPPETIQRIMRLNAGRFRSCYQQALLRSPGLTGRARIRFVITRSGMVRSSRVDGLDHAPELATCMARQMYAIGFPQPVDGFVAVVYPWLLNPLDGPRAPRRFGYR
jgi:hypothetical protein